MTDSRHLVRHAADAAPAVPTWAAGRSTGFRRWSVVDEAGGAAHTGFGVNELDAGGTVEPFVASYETSVFMLEGEAVLSTSEGSTLLRPGDYGLVPVGVPFAWRNEGSALARWADMLAPQPRTRYGEDVFAAPPLRDEPAVPVDPRDPRTRSFGHVDPGNMDPAQQTQDKLAVSASMRTALLVYSGISVKMMVDTDLGAQLQTMFMVQYEPGGFAGPHDHPLEETYLILDGETDAVFDGRKYRLRPGDIAWAGVGCVHEFANATPDGGTVRWLETQAPAPPPRHSYRFARDWNYLRDQRT